MPDVPDPDIRAAATPGAALYGAEVYARHRRALFPHAWQLAPLARSAPERGHVAPWTLLPDCLDEPLLWVTDDQGTTRCLGNVCTHRGRVLVECAGAQRALRCPYHGRTFGLDGRLRSAPGFEGALHFPGPEDHLPEVASDAWHGFRFAALAPSVPFADWIAPLETVAGHLADALPPDPTEVHDYEFDANWALYLDNYLEGFHIPYVHAGLAPVLDWSEYRVELFPWASLQVGLAAAGEPTIDLPPGHPHRGQRVAGYWLWLHPNTLFNFYPWGVSINVVEPRGAARTRVHYRVHVARPELRARGAGADLDRVEGEDEREVMAVQRGVFSRMYRGGRYAPEHEVAVHHFHRLLATVGE
jgi:choline monooxygenase